MSDPVPPALRALLAQSDHYGDLHEPHTVVATLRAVAHDPDFAGIWVGFRIRAWADAIEQEAQHGRA